MLIILYNSAPLVRDFFSGPLLHKIAIIIDFFKPSVPYEVIGSKLLNIAGNLEPSEIWPMRHSPIGPLRGAEFLWELI